ncbi:hypothetical protein COLO4_04918 [Corchorus olitorius]|uniref:RNA polymerase II C-terminal domain phosphatase-like n=1 Tax=Corchorus olitorius TaxID=93759 RepID=A0A1R3KSG0_9ROSI|nr:hypothetical protein COLO4_04918 [Corchorus olitorius]
MVAIVPTSDDLATNFASVLSIKEERGVQELLHQLQQYPNETKDLETSSIPSKSSTCQHPSVVVDGVCYNCRQKIENEHTYGLELSYLRLGLRLSHSEINRLRCLESKKQLSQKKLHLVLNIDHTLIHTLRLEKASKLGLSCDDKDTKEIDNGACLVKLRPHVLEFLEKANTMFEMYLYTLGSRPYAKKIAQILDPQGIYFGHRIISRDDNPLAASKVKTLDLLLAQKSKNLILDDNFGVWPKHEKNLILTKEFVFTGKETEETEMNNTLILKEIFDNVLYKIHSAFFNEKIHNDVRMLAAELRSNVLRGCILCMKRVKNSELWDMAMELGATCCDELNSCVTHLVSIWKKGRQENVWAVENKIYLVHVGWIRAAYYSWKRPPEENFHITLRNSM